MEAAVAGLILIAGLAIVGLSIWAVVVCFRKRKIVFAWLGIASIVVPGLATWLGSAGIVVLGLVLFTWIGAVRLGKPSSSFARRYDDEQMAEAMARFMNDPKVQEVCRWKPVGDLKPGDRIGNPTGMFYEVAGALVSGDTNLKVDVLYADGRTGTRSWLRDQVADGRWLWDPEAVTKLRADL